MSAMIATNRILAKKTAFTGDAQRPYVEIPFFGNEVDERGNHYLGVAGDNPNSHGDYDKYLWVEYPSPSSFFDEVFREDAAKKPVLLVIHGYNNDFPDVVDKHTRFHELLSSKTGFQGTLLSYTWPSRGGGHLYATDRRMAFASRAHFHEFADALLGACSTQDRPLIAISHSMGNFLMRETARDQRKAHGAPARPWFDRLLMVGADVNYHLFDTNAGKVTDDGGSALCDIAQKIVVLFWAGDPALKLSEEWEHVDPEAKRLGRVGPAHPDLLPKSVTCKDMDGFLTTHGGYLTEPKAVQVLAGYFAKVRRT